MPSRPPIVALCVVVAASLAVGKSASAASPSPTGEVTYLVERLGPGPDSLNPSVGPSSDCSGAFQRLRLTTAEGKPAGVGTACFVRLGSRAYEDLYSLELTLRLAGGTIRAVAGTSFAHDQNGQPIFNGPDYCSLMVAFGGFETIEALGCAGLITSATGLFASHDGWVTYRYTWSDDVFTPEGPIWVLQPTITIDFS